MKRVLPAGLVLLGLLTGATVARADVAGARALGRPDFKEGKARGYFVWKDGDTWKVRWTTFGNEHRFNGRVAVEGGAIEVLNKVDVDSERRVIRPGRPPVRNQNGKIVRRGRDPKVVTREEDHIRLDGQFVIRFSTQTDDDIDGFDFKVTSETVLVRFTLEIDGKAAPDEVEIGRRNFKPKEHPLVIRLR